MVQISFHFEYSDQVELLLDRHGIAHFVRLPMMQGRDIDGKHYGTQVFPGNVSVVMAQVPDDAVRGFVDDLEAFRRQKKGHEHIDIVVWPIEKFGLES